MIKNIVLSSFQIEEIKKKAIEVRKVFGVYEDVPIASDIFMLLEKNNIILCEFPFQSSGKSHIDATLTRFETNGEPIIFMGLNTSLHFDEQIFAIAHELYHFITKTGKSYTEDMEEDPLNERQADRFAAELLLPGSALRTQVILEFQTEHITSVQYLRVLRFIARLQCEWWLPYRAIVNRLFEEGYIQKELFQRLYKMEDRNEDSLYFRIFKALDPNKHMLLNKRTGKKGVSGRAMEIILLNYEEGLMPDDEFVQLLAMFGKSPEDFGYEMSVASEDLEEIEDLLGGDE